MVSAGRAALSFRVGCPYQMWWQDRRKTQQTPIRADKIRGRGGRGTTADGAEPSPGTAPGRCPKTVPSGPLGRQVAFHVKAPAFQFLPPHAALGGRMPRAAPRRQGLQAGRPCGWPVQDPRAGGPTCLAIFSGDLSGRSSPHDCFENLKRLLAKPAKSATNEAAKFL